MVKIDPSTKYEIVDAYAKDTLQAKLELEEEDLLYAYEQLSEEDKEQLNPIYNRITEIMGDIVSEASEEETGLFD